MVLESLINPPTFVAGFGVALFVSLAVLLKLQAHYKSRKEAHLVQVLRTYVSSAHETVEAAQQEKCA
jgi:hypothetical protein